MTFNPIPFLVLLYVPLVILLYLELIKRAVQGVKVCARLYRRLMEHWRKQPSEDL